MTIRLLATYQGIPPQSIVTLAGPTETALVADGNATADLTGGTPYVPPVVANKTIAARVAVGVDGVALGLVDSRGAFLSAFSGIEAPGAPTGLTLTAIAGGVIAAFAAPASNGGSEITEYEVTLSTGQKGSNAASPVVVLAPAGTPVTATVKARNGYAQGVASSASTSATPTAPPTIPGAPAIGTATAGDGSVTVAFSAPASDGGAAITGYKVTLSNGDIATGASSPITVSGQTNGLAKTAVVSAMNAIGYGPASGVSNSVIPVNLPTPVLLTAFDTLTGATGTNATLTLEATNKLQGTGSIKIAGAGAASGAYLSYTTAAAYKPSDLGTVVGLFNVETRDNQTSCTLQVLRAGDGHSATVSDNATKSRLGWRAIAFNAAEGNAGWQAAPAGTLILRPKSDSSLANNSVICADAVYMNSKGVPRFIPTYDDAHVEQYTVVFPYYVANKIKGTLYIPTQRVGLTNCLTWAMIREMRDSGLFQIAIDSTRNDGATSADPATVVAELDAARAELAANGALDGKGGEWHLCWTFGTLPAENVLLAVEAAGYKTARGVEPGINYTRFGFLDQALSQYARGFSNTSNLALFSVHYDRAKAVGANFITLTHGVNDLGGSIDTPYTNVFLPGHQKFLTDRAAGTMVNTTMAEAWEADHLGTPP